MHEAQPEIFALECIAPLGVTEPRQRLERVLYQDDLAPRIATLREPVAVDLERLEIIRIFGERGEQRGLRCGLFTHATVLDPTSATSLLHSRSASHFARIGDVALSSISTSTGSLALSKILTPLELP